MTYDDFEAQVATMVANLPALRGRPPSAGMRPALTRPSRPKRGRETMTKPCPFLTMYIADYPPPLRTRWAALLLERHGSAERIRKVLEGHIQTAAAERRLAEWCRLEDNSHAAAWHDCRASAAESSAGICAAALSVLNVVVTT